MTTRLFNGSTLTFGTSIGRLVGLHYTKAGQVVDVTEPADLTKLCEVGQPDLELTAKVKRMPTVDVGDIAATPSISWADGSSTPLSGSWIITHVGGGGDFNAPITGDITMKPTIAGDSYEYGGSLSPSPSPSA